MRAEMSVQSPIAHSGDMPLVSPKGVMSRQATSCSISVQLAGMRRDTEASVLRPKTESRGREPRGRTRAVCSPDLPELLGSDLQVVEGSSHSHHYLVTVTGSHADVLSIGLLPLAHQGFGLLTNQSHRGRGDLGRGNTSAQSQNTTSLLTPAQGSTANPALDNQHRSRSAPQSIRAVGSP